VSIFRDESSTYFRFGPQDDLILISVKINTWLKWWMTFLCIGVLKIGEVIVNEIGSPILGFNVYNPDKKVITDFTKNELNLITNAMWFVNNMRSILTVVISITQFDLAFMSVIVSELTSIYTVRILLNEKEFVPSGFTQIQETDRATLDESVNEESVNDEPINERSVNVEMV